MRALSLVVREKTDEQILTGMRRLINLDRKRKSDFLVFLGEADKRKLYAKQGYSSLFRWLTEEYRFSESSALKRIQVARLASKFPFLYRDVSQGMYSLSAFSRLAPFVNGSNAHLLFPKARGKSVREVEAYLMDCFPKADVEDRLKKSVSPLGVDRHQVQFTAGTEFIEDLEKVRDLLSHRYPQGKLEEILGLALKTLLNQLEKPGKSASPIPRGMSENKSASVQPQVAAQPSKPVNPVSRYIPRGIQNAVRARDENRCQHKKPDGTLCGETRFLEIDHVQPYALGGRHTRENLRLLCWAHNALRAEARFGKIRPGPGKKG